jgi:hypothetical protein
VAEKITAYVTADPDTAVWYVYGANYRTHESVCGPLRTRLVASLGVLQAMYARVGRGWEKAGLERFTR